MAIWQTKLDFVPEKAILHAYGVIPIAIPQSLEEDFPAWIDIQPPCGFEKWIDSFLPEAKSWSDSMKIWGDESSNTISACYHDNTLKKVEWIGARIDVRQLSYAFIGDVCSLAKKLECIFLTGSNHVITPNEALILQAIDVSTAKKYIEDPVSTLRGLKRSNCEIISFPKKH